MARTPRIRTVCAALFATTTFSSAALSQSEPTSEEPAPAQITNEFCPVMPEEPVDPNFFVDYQGQRVYLCCRRCQAKFTADPEAYVVNLASFQTQTQAEDQPEQQEEGAPEVGEPDESPSDDEHAHAEEAAPDEPIEILPYLGRFHVVTVHFPIALLLVGALLELVGVAAPKSRAQASVPLFIGLGALSALVAAPLGLAHAIENTYSGDLGGVFWWHRALGIAVAILAVVAFGAVAMRGRKESPARAGAPTLLVLATALLTFITGHLGGSLVFGWDYLFPN